MVKRFELTEEQIFETIKNGEFGNEIIASAPLVVILLTQNWCPQWHTLKAWLYKERIDLPYEVHIYECIYNTKNYFREFMNFKENHFHNHEVPYLRFYKRGKFFTDTNYIWEEEFINLIK